MTELKLYLVKYDLITKINKNWYSGKEEMTKLVYAESVDEVKEKLDKVYDKLSRSTSRNASYEVQNLSASEAIM